MPARPAARASARGSPRDSTRDSARAPARAKRGYHHGDLKHALIEAALAHIKREGARGISLREVARGAGVSHTASYRHFPSKESLLAAIAEQGFGLLNEKMRAAMEPHADDPLASWRACGVAYVEFGVQYPEHLQVMFGGHIANAERYPTLQQAGHACFELLASSVRAALAAGLMGGASERVIAYASWAIVHGLAQLIAGYQIRHEPEEPMTPTQLAELVTGLLQTGVAARKR
jgi:AcrR family transcriptional regulator